MKKILFILPAILLVVQAFDETIGGYLSYVRGTLLILMILVFFLYYKLKLDLVSKAIIVFLTYTFFLSFESTNILKTLLSYTSICVSFSFYIISYSTISNYSQFYRFKVLFWTMPFIYIFSAVIFSFFNLSNPIYGEYQIVNMGPGLHHNTIYTGILIISIYFVLRKYSEDKLRDTILITTMAILILLSYRRTAIILLMVSCIIFITMSKKQNLFKYVIPGMILLITTYPLYNEYVTNYFKARGTRANFEYGIQSETRFKEVTLITERILNANELKYFFFGMEFLNSEGTYYSSRFPVLSSRPLHSDYAVVLHGSGFVGITLYFFLLISILCKTIQCVKFCGLKNDLSIMTTILTSILILVTFSGSILSITFRTTLFLFLGSLMRIVDQTILTARHKQKNTRSVVKK